VAHPRAEEVKTAATVRELDLPAVRRIRSPHDATPQAHLLSNGRYTVMLTAAGSGYSRWGDIAITRWREDATRDDCAATYSCATCKAARCGPRATSPRASSPSATT
jgi:cyclic beta-1,2-glucan synthetase